MARNRPVASPPSMPRPNLIYAETLCWIAKLGTFSAAAQRLHTTQPAVSARMKELESSLGFALFEKRGRRMELTLPARHFVARVEPLLRSVENVFNDAEAAINPTGTLRIGLGEVGMTWFGKLIPALRLAFPRLTYEIELELGITLQEQLEDGTLDLAVVANTSSNPALVYQSLGTAPMIWVGASALLHGADGRPRPLAELLTQEPLWCVSKPSDYFTLAHGQLRERGANMANLSTCNKLKGLVDIVMAGGGISLLPHAMVKDAIALGALAPLPAAMPGQNLDFSLATHRNQNQSSVIRLVEKLLQLSRTVPI